jgi:hypothetical protein
MMTVMAGLVPAIHVVSRRQKGVNAPVRPGHDERRARWPLTNT